MRPHTAPLCPALSTERETPFELFRHFRLRPRIAASGCALLWCICLSSIAADTKVEPTPSATLDALQRNIQTNLELQLTRVVNNPNGRLRFNVTAETVEMIQTLRRLPSPPALRWAESADRYRLLALLEIILARAEGERITYAQGAPGIESNKIRSNYAQQALKDIELSTAHMTAETELEWVEWLNKEDLAGHLLHLGAHAHAIVWAVSGSESNRVSARRLWEQAGNTRYGQEHPQPSPELASALGLRPNPPMLIMLWVGLGLLAAMIVVAIAIPNPTSFQMWVFRIVTALGGGGIGANLPGFLGFQSPYVTAGGAAAFVVLFYLVNPPRLARNLAGKDKS